MSSNIDVSLDDLIKLNKKSGKKVEFKGNKGGKQGSAPQRGGKQGGKAKQGGKPAARGNVKNTKASPKSKQAAQNVRNQVSKQVTKAAQQKRAGKIAAARGMDIDSGAGAAGGRKQKKIVVKSSRSGAMQKFAGVRQRKLSTGSDTGKTRQGQRFRRGSNSGGRGPAPNQNQNKPKNANQQGNKEKKIVVTVTNPTATGGNKGGVVKPGREQIKKATNANAAKAARKQKADALAKSARAHTAAKRRGMDIDTTPKKPAAKNAKKGGNAGQKTRVTVTTARGGRGGARGGARGGRGGARGGRGGRGGRR